MNLPDTIALPVDRSSNTSVNMALSMKMRANARVVSGRRVAVVAPRVVPFSSVARPVLRSSFAPEVSIDIRRVGRSRIVVEAVSYGNRLDVPNCKSAMARY
jgi:hypothetical protein